MGNLSRVRKLGGLGVFVSIFFLFSSSINAQINPQKLLIVEVQIAGEKTTDDYIKIYNPTESDIYLGNYNGSYLRLVKRTKTSSKDYSIKSWSKDSEAKIPAKGFYIWANKDYTNLPNVNTFTSQTLASNNGIALRLGPENTGAIIDAVGWGDFANVLFEENAFSENPSPNQRLKRREINGVYQDTDNNSRDFYLDPPSEIVSPKPATSPQEILPEPEPQKESKSTTTPQSEIKLEQTFPSNIVINEILPSPVDSDAENEWIEIWNQNDFEVDLTGWKITDVVGSKTTYNFPEGTKISAQRFLVLSRPTTKITLNNDADGLILIRPDGEVIDSVSYEKAPLGQSYNRTDLEWFWSLTLTSGSKNIIKTKEEIKEDVSKKSPKEVIGEGVALPGESEKERIEEGLAAIGEQLPKGRFSTLFVLLIALLTAISLGGIILVLKRKLKS